MYLIKLNFGIKSVVGYRFIEQLLTVESQNIFGTFVKCISRILPEMKKPMKFQDYLFDYNFISSIYAVYKNEILWRITDLTLRKSLMIVRDQTLFFL